MSLCLRPSDVLLVTYNHMDAIRGFACDNPAISSQVENVYKLLYEVKVNNFFGTWGNRLYKQTYPMALSGNGAGLMYDRDKWLLGEF